MLCGAVLASCHCWRGLRTFLFLPVWHKYVCSVMFTYKQVLQKRKSSLLFYHAVIPAAYTALPCGTSASTLHPPCA